jgi:urease
LVLTGDRYESTKMPGAVVVKKTGSIVLSEGRKRIRLKVTSKGDRPIQVTMDAFLRDVLC